MLRPSNNPQQPMPISKAAIENLLRSDEGLVFGYKITPVNLTTGQRGKTMVVTGETANQASALLMQNNERKLVSVCSGRRPFTLLAGPESMLLLTEP